MDYTTVQRWIRPSSSDENGVSARYFATNEKGDPRPWLQEEFATFMTRFGFTHDFTLDETGPHWTDPSKPVRSEWHSTLPE